MGEVKVWQVIFANDDPQITRQVLDGSINTIECQRCHNSAPVYVDFLYADLENLRAVFVPTAGLSEVENAAARKSLLEFATQTLDTTRKDTFMARVQEAKDYRYISERLRLSDEEVGVFNRDYANYLEWEGLPAVEKIEKIVETALTGRSFIFTEAELDDVFGSALAHQLQDAKKQNQNERVSVLTQLVARLEQARAQEQKQVEAEDEPTSYSLNLPETSQTWELVRNASKLMNASELITEKSPADTVSPATAEDQEPADGNVEDDTDFELFFLNLREAARAKRDLKMEADYSNALGEIYERKGRRWRAIGCFERALRIGEKLNDNKCKAMALGGLGTVYLAKGEAARGIANLQTAMKFSVLAEDYRTYAVLTERLGRAKRDLGHFDTAKQCLEIALGYYRQIQAQTGSNKEASWCLYQLGALCIELGEFEEAKTYLLEALALYKGQDRSMEMRTLTYLGNCCFRMGEPIGADVRSYLVRDSGDSSSMMIERVPTSEGIKYLEQALEIVTNDHERMGILTNLSAINLSTGYYHRALRYYEEIIEILEGGRGSVETYHLSNLANIWLEKYKAHKNEGKLDAAKEAIQKAFEYLKAAVSLSLEDPVVGRPETFPHITQLAYCAELIEDYAEALKWYRYVAGFTEGVRVSFKDTKHKEFFNQTSILSFVRASRCALRQAEVAPANESDLINEAFYYAEAAKCRLLADMINDTPEPYETTDQSFMSQLPAELRQKIQFASEAPVGLHPAGVDEIASKLDSETALLEYSMMQHLEDRKGFWALFAALPGRRDIKLLHRADLEEVHAARGQLYKIIEKLENDLTGAGSKDLVEQVLEQSRSAYETALLNLGQILIPQKVIAELDSLSIRRLIIVPEAYLFDMPWSALRVNVGDRTVPLIGQDDAGEGFEIVVAPSASVFIQCHNRTKERFSDMPGSQPTALLFGGPGVNANSNFSDFVGETIGQKILSDHFNSRHFFDESASLENLIDGMSSANLCFFYGHASYDYDDPLESHLTISAGTAGDCELTAREILSWQANRIWASCALFIMASCEGQRADYGHLWDAREIIGLSTAIFQCGVSSVIGSLWRIRIATVCKLYPQFFIAYTSGNTASKSLRAAQLELQKRNDVFSHPHLWGGIYLMGDYDASIVNSNG